MYMCKRDINSLNEMQKKAMDEVLSEAKKNPKGAKNRFWIKYEKDKEKEVLKNITPSNSPEELSEEEEDNEVVMIPNKKFEKKIKYTHKLECNKLKMKILSLKNDLLALKKKI